MSTLAREEATGYGSVLRLCKDTTIFRSSQIFYTKNRSINYV